MSLATKADLKTAVASWLERSGDAAISGSADDLIKLAESSLNRRLPLRAMKTETTLTGVVSSRSLTLPADYVEPHALFLTTSGRYERLRPFVAGTEALAVDNGEPRAWAITGATISLDRPCDDAHSFAFRYRQSFTLAADGDANWLLTNHPDVYLFATLVEATVFLMDSDSGAVWAARLEKALREVAEKDARGETLAELSVDPGLTADRWGGFNRSTGALW